MATIYLRSTNGTADADNGSTWALAKTTLAAALTAAGAGGTVYMSQAHAESSGSSITLASPGTAASPVRVLCVNDGAEPPTALATGGAVQVSGHNIGIVGTGFTYMYGVTLRAAAGGNTNWIGFGSTDPYWWRLDNCAITFLNTNSGALFMSTASNVTEDGLVEIINSTITFSSASFHVIQPSKKLVMEGGSIGGSTVPTTLLKPSSNSGPDVFVRLSGVDLSAFGSGKNLIDGSTANTAIYTLENCKLGSSVTIVTGTVPGNGAAEVRMVNCDSADTNYRYHKQTFSGSISQEATIVRTGGASDGTTPISRKMVSSANAKFFSPLQSDPITYWNETTGSSITATVEIVTDNVTLTDAEAWIEVEYLGTSGFPLSSVSRDRAADILATPANQTTSSVTWTTTGLGTPVKQKLSASFTPQEKGPVKIRVMLAKASTTMYFCPKVDIT